MSEVASSDPIYSPVLFPLDGRLPLDEQTVRENYDKQLAKNTAITNNPTPRIAFAVHQSVRRFYLAVYFDRPKGPTPKLVATDVFGIEPYKNQRGKGMNASFGTLRSWISGCLFLGVSGCSVGQPDYLAGDLNGVNHTSAGINHFSVNGYGGANIAPYGDAGGTCCVMLPRVWRPGLKMLVEWELDPDPYAKSPPLVSEEFGVFMIKHKAGYQRHVAVVELPPYEEKLCSPEVHFLPCNQIKISTSCWAYPSPNSPIKEPLKMNEPAVCPK